MTGEHLARYLRIARLIGAEEAEICQAKEKQKPAETGKQQPIHKRMAARIRGGRIRCRVSGLCNHNLQSPI